MKRINFLFQLLIGVVAFSFMSVAQAGGPLWTFAPVNGFPSTLTISNTGTATVKYTVINQTRQKRILVMQPQVGISQVQPCVVNPRGRAGSSCTLTLTINGSLLPISGVVGGPKLCQSSRGKPNPNLCYQPSPANILKISVIPVPTLVSIDVTPANAAIPQGVTQQYTATGVYSDSSTKDLTSSVKWSTSNTNIATISTTGLAQGVTQGAVVIKAASGAVTGTANLVVSNAKLQSIVVRPLSRTIAKGTTQQFIAFGTFTDGSTLNITSSVIWTSSTPLVATVSNRLGMNGLATGRSAGITTIRATLGTISNTANLTVTDAVLQSINVTPINPTIAQGITQQFTATGVYSDNTTQDITTSVNWVSSNTSIATISNTGSAQGVAKGNVSITATSGSIAGTTNLTVTNATLLSIAVSPLNSSIAKGTSQQFIATGAFSDGSTHNITSSVIWDSSNPVVAVISNDAGINGSATGLTAGATTITATLGSVSGTASLTVTNAVLTAINVAPTNQALAQGLTQQFTATGIYSDNTTQNLTNSVTWSSSDTAIVTILNTGLAQTISQGTVAIKATLDSISGTTNLTVTNATLSSIKVTPANTNLAIGTTQQFIATGTFTDGSTKILTSAVDWSSSSPEFATISSDPVTNGLATGIAVGATTITAKIGTVSGSTNLSVTNAFLTSISVTPVSASIPLGFNQQYMATGIFSDNSTQDLTTSVDWSTSNASIAQISSVGLATGLGTGSVNITATSGALSATASLTVTNATIQSIAVTPANSSIANKTTQQFIAQGTFSDGSTHNITSSVTWTSANTAVATFTDEPLNNGLITGVSLGQTNISAKLGTVQGTTTLTVTDATLVAINVSPVSKSLPQGQSQQFTATGVNSDGTTQDMTAKVSWVTSNSTVATIDNLGKATASATPGTQGTVIITATSNGISGTANLTVTNATLQSIAVTPTNPSVVKQSTQQFVAIGTFSNGSTLDITSTVTWSSSNPTAATISNVTGSVGLATTGSTPNTTTTIKAEINGVSGTTNLSVTDATLTSIQVTPVNPLIRIGAKQQFIATGIYSNGTSADITNNVGWNSSNSSVATISSTGEVTAKAAGSATIQAYSGAITGTTTLNVSAAVLQSIDIKPTTAQKAAGTEIQYTATGVYSDGSTANITSLVAWTSSNPVVADFSDVLGDEGLATTYVPGTTTIKAASGNVFSTTNLTVSDATVTAIQINPVNQVIAKGVSLTFTATAIYSDDTQADVPASWATSNGDVATITDTTGEATGVNPGSVTITATYQNVAGTTTLTVTNATLQTITVTPADSSLAIGASQQFIATGSFSDGTNHDLTNNVTWSSSAPATASIALNGVATGVAVGTTTVQASLNGVSGTTSLMVTDAQLTAITVEPANIAIPQGVTQQYTAMGHYSDNTTRIMGSNEVTWTSLPVSPSTQTVATIDSLGVATSVSQGTTTITATSGAISGSTSLNVTSATLQTLTVTPTGTKIVVDATQQFVATGIFTDGTNYDLTSTVSWSSSPSIATISNLVGSKGVATGVSAGSTSITATIGSVSGSTTLSVENGFTLGGEVKNLTEGTGFTLTLTNNGGDPLVINTNGSFTFSEKYVSGSPYNVAVSVQPSGQTCIPTNSTGTLNNNVTNVEITCNTTFLHDDFTGPSATLPWIAIDQACLTAEGLNTGTIPTCLPGTEGAGNATGLTPDQDGNGVLRLTITPNAQKGGIIEPTPIPTAQGLSLTFDVYSYSDEVNSGADGISFIILNADNGAAPTSLGCVGSGLGYGNIKDGYLGIGLDEYGNYSKTPICSSGTNPDQANSIVIRGATVANDPNTSNPYIIGTQPGFSLWENVALRPSTPLRYQIIFTSAGVVSVFLNGTPYLAGINVVPFTGTTIPQNLYFGFASSTGTHYNIHEIQKFAISIPISTSLDMSLSASPSSFNKNELNQNYVFTIRNTGGTPSSGTIQLFDNFPTGITVAGQPQLSGPGAAGATISNCNISGTSLGNSCIISGAVISSIAPNNYLTVTVPVNVSDAATTGNNSASLFGGGDNGCISQAYSPYLCSGSVTVSINPAIAD